jgi:6-phosphogluconolactonase
MEGELEATVAAEKYRRILDERFTDAGIDIILLGMGDDGHTASLFPNTQATREKTRSVIGYFAENSSTGKSWRITMTAPFINRAQQVMFLICGASKEKRLAEVLEGPRDPERLPSQLIAPSPGNLILLLDSAAAGMHHD